MSDTYLTIGKPTRAEITVKASRFIGEAFPVANADEALAELEIIRKREFTASHHCSAYRVGIDGGEFRYSDDGEPNRTAGPPILQQIDGRNLTNTLVVVTRYYGGTNLGTGGLIRAYGDTASAALDNARIETRILQDRVSLRFGYDDTSPAMHTINQFGAQILETNYGDDTEIIASIRQSETSALMAAFVTALSGRGEAEMIDV